jgi:hypothetical protein
MRWIRAPRWIQCIPAHPINREARIHRENLRLNIKVRDTRDTDGPWGTGGADEVKRAREGLGEKGSGAGRGAKAGERGGGGELGKIGAGDGLEHVDG